MDQASLVGKDIEFTEDSIKSAGVKNDKQLSEEEQQAKLRSYFGLPPLSKVEEKKCISCRSSYESVLKSQGYCAKCVKRLSCTYELLDRSHLHVKGI